MHSNTQLWIALFAILIFGYTQALTVRSLKSTLQSEDANVTCETCPMGTYSVVNSTLNCTELCPVGSCPSTYNCSACPVGTYNNQTNQGACDSCPVGSVASGGAVNCTLCGPGTSNNEDFSKCAPCDEGTFSNGTGHACSPCLPGEFTGVKRSTRCERCQKGSYNQYYGQKSCTPCGTGFYNPSIGQTSKDDCLKCPASFYCPDPLTGQPLTCPKNTFCKDGASKPTPCPILMESDEGSESCHPTTKLYLAVLGSVGILVLIISVAVYWRARTLKDEPSAQRITLQATESDRLIPPPLDGPVYAGL